MKKKVPTTQTGPVSMNNLPTPLVAEEPLVKHYTEAEMALLAEASVVLGYDQNLTGLTLRQVLKELGMKVIKSSTLPPYRTVALEKASKVTMPQKFGAHWKGRFAAPRFRIVSLSEFKGIVPGDLLQQAVLIKRKCPIVRFEVEYLALGESRDPDPFLIASIEGQRLYIAVWEEPDFVADYVDPDDDED